MQRVARVRQRQLSFMYNNNNTVLCVTDVTDDRSCGMRGGQVRLLVFVAATSVAAVGFVLGTAVLSIFIVFSLKSLFTVVISAIAFIAELIVAVVAAITSGSVSHIVL